MLEYPKPKELNLKEILSNDFNKGIYNFYHKVDRAVKVSHLGRIKVSSVNEVLKVDSFVA